jgi:hypothetical protein
MSEAALQPLFERGRLWRGQGNVLPRSALPTGFTALDAVLPGGGWPAAALSEILLPADGVGELQLLWPLLARLSAQGGRIVLVAPPYVPFAPAWGAAGIALSQLQIVQTDDDRNARWVAEQCLRSAACAAVVCWPRQGDARTLRRLQLAAETGQCQGFALRPAGAADQPSMAALRILIEVDPPQWRVLKCRGGNPPARAVPLPLQSIMLSRAARRSLPPSPERLHRSGGESARSADVLNGIGCAGERLGHGWPRPELLARQEAEPGAAKGEGEKPLVGEALRLSAVPAPSPSATRSALRAASPPSEADGREGEQPRVLQCRGGNPPARAVPLPSRHSGAARVVCGQNPESGLTYIGGKTWIPGSIPSGDGPGMTTTGEVSGGEEDGRFVARAS